MIFYFKKAENSKLFTEREYYFCSISHDTYTRISRMSYIHVYHTCISSFRQTTGNFNFCRSFLVNVEQTNYSGTTSAHPSMHTALKQRLINVDETS